MANNTTPDKTFPGTVQDIITSSERNHDPASDATAAPVEKDCEQGVHDARSEEDKGEGGLHAWLSVAGSFLVYFASFGVVNSFGYFQTFYQLNYLSNYPAPEIAFIGTLQIGLMYLSGGVAGVLFDTYGLKVNSCRGTRCSCRFVFI